MDEQERLKYKKKWRLWEWITGILSLVGFRTKNISKMGDVILPRLDSEPPMLELDRLAKGVIGKERTLAISKSEQIYLMLQLMSYTAERDGQVNPKAITFVERFLDENLSARIGFDQKKIYMNYFLDCEGKKVNIKNSAILFRGRSKPQLRNLLINAIYDLAYMAGMDENLRRDVNDIGRWLDVSATRMRQAAFAARQRWETTNSK